MVLKAALAACLHLTGEEYNTAITTILKMVQQQNLFYQFFGEALQDQLQSAGELLLFRETNTPTSKLLQRYLMLHGRSYLRESIIPLIQKAAKKQKSYEVRP